MRHYWSYFLSRNDFAGTIPTPVAESAAGTFLKDQKRQHISHTLRRDNGHKSATSRALGIDRKTLREKLKRYNIE
jgi:DNA-binding NtrC family response regulator